MPHPDPAGDDLSLDEIRRAAARVAGEAELVRLHPDRIEGYAGELAARLGRVDDEDPAHHDVGGEDETRALFVLALDAVNFGSGWFPVLRKRPGHSGYHTVAAALRDHVSTAGIDAGWLAGATTATCRRLFDQEQGGPADDLMGWFARSWRDLGDHLEAAHGGSALALVAAAGGSAEALARELAATQPLFRDVSTYRGEPVPFYKRAQIAAADLARAFRGSGPGRFTDLDRLTLFADNLVPHVLRVDGLVAYDDGLLARIEAGRLLTAGSPEEVEIRAVAVHAVELLVEALRARGVPDATAAALDAVLWHRGAGEQYKAAARHRCRTTAY